MILYMISIKIQAAVALIALGENARSPLDLALQNKTFDPLWPCSGNFADFLGPTRDERTRTRHTPDSGTSPHPSQGIDLGYAIL
ncbi:uncharacterized protein ARMOST_07358 [Armillaria ostoyae]|uniref:Uncharacterized protein n=1 Tax=Armillaria ostoyae TaxID=47428 RepID=A0A284R5L3_ARMOS|nr:uncharacterized protein ARMOST_07358 [Armillaria ostoyae]